MADKAAELGRARQRLHEASMAIAHNLRMVATLVEGATLEADTLRRVLAAHELDTVPHLARLAATMDAAAAELRALQSAGAPPCDGRSGAREGAAVPLHSLRGRNAALVLTDHAHSSLLPRTR